MKSSKRIIVLKYLLFILLINQITTSVNTIDYPNTEHQLFEEQTSSTYITLNIVNYEEIKDNYFIISTSSQNLSISTTIFSSVSENQPSTKNSDIYSTQRFGNTYLVLRKEIFKEKIYLNITCNIYPCTYELHLSSEKNIVLNRDQLFSYYIKNNINEQTAFKIPSQTSENMLNSTPNKSGTHILSIIVSFSNEENVESELELFLDENTNNNKLKATEGIKLESSYNLGTKIIYYFKEEDLIKKYEGDPDLNNYYILNIKSKNDQYITISLNTKELYEEKDIPVTKVIPNEGGKFSILKKDILKEECYKINTDLNGYSDILIFASISFYSNPVKYYFNDDKKEKIIPTRNKLSLVFEKNEDNSYKDLCFILNKEEDEGIFKIEISETNDIYKKNNINDPLNTGTIYFRSLHKKGLTYFTHNPSNRNINEMNFNLKVSKGIMEMFIVKCDTFPDCYYNYEELLKESKNLENKKVVRPHIINDMFSYSEYTKEGEIDLAPYNYEQNLMYIYCNESSVGFCQFEISYFTDKDKILLLNDDKFYQYMLKDETDLYQIHIPKLSDPFSKIQVILYTFTGDSSYKHISCTNESLVSITHDFVGGKEVYEYTLKDKDVINKNDFSIEFNIFAETNTYYEVEYKIIKLEYDKTILENKIFFDEKYTLVSTHITFKDSVKYVKGNDENNKKYFVFQNNRIEEGNPYFVQIFSLNCKINVNREGKIITKSEDLYQDIITPNDTYYENKYYIYEMNIESIENYGDEDVENQCIVYISGEPFDEEETSTNNINKNKILLTENDPHEIILTNETKTYRYLFPYLGNSDDIYSFMLIHINFDSKMSAKAKFYFDDSDVKKEETIGRSRQILLSNKLIKENCKDIEEICNVIIEINFNNVDKYDKSWSSPNFQLFISTNNMIPSYLKNGKLRTDSVVRSSPKQYFYTDISRNTEGQVIINTKRGEGVLYARLYEKGTVDQNKTWGDIEIPDEKTEDILYYDVFTHSVHFEQEHTRKCGDKGCLLLITYENTYSPSNNKDYLTSFSLLTRLYNREKEKQSVLEIPFKAYVYGAIENRLLTYNYFIIHFPEDSAKIDFEVQCETCILYINKNETLPTPENHDLEYYSEGKFGVFSYEINRTEKIKNKYYTIRIESPIIASRYVTTYSLRVLLPTPSLMVNYNLIPVDSDQIANCDLSLRSNDGICYFILYIDDDANYIGDILAHVYTDVDLIDLEINANFIPKEIAERAVLDEMLDYLPESKEQSSFSTENAFYSDYLLIDINQRKNNDYIIFGVASDNSATVTFLSTFYSYKNDVVFNPNNVQLMKMESNSKMDLTLASNNYYLVYLYSLFGEGEIKWEDEKGNKKNHIFSEHELFSFTCSLGESKSIINSIDKDLAFYIWQDVRQAEFIMNEMEFNMREKFIYTESDLSFKYYCLLPLIKNENKTVNFQDLIFNIELGSPEKIGINKDNNLIVEGSIINMEMINKIKKEKSDEKIIKNKITAKYDITTNSAFIILNKTYCEYIWNQYTTQNSNAYLYISIKPQKSDGKKYEISGSMIASFRNNINYVIPSNQIIRTNIDFKENEINYILYNLQLDGSYDKNKIILDISPNININENNILYSFIDYSNANKINETIIRKNSSNIEIDENSSKYMGGKYHIEFKLKEQKVKGIYLCLFTNKKQLKQNGLKSVNVLFNYLSYEPSYKLPEYEIDNKIQFTKNKDNIALNINKVKKIENSRTNYPTCEFIIRKIKYEKKIENEELSTISLIESDHELLYKYEDKSNNPNVEITIPYKNENNEKYYLSIIANLYGEKETFAYSTLDSEKAEPGKESEKSERNTTAMVVLIIVMVLVVVIIIVVLYLYIMKKNYSSADDMLKISFNEKDGELNAINQDETALTI